MAGRIFLIVILASLPIGSLSLEERVCSSREIKNCPQELERLRNCTVIEGSLLIYINHPNFYFNEPHNYSYPELREITDYLILYRTPGLRSLAQLFPNLAVIRGRELLGDYALLIHENQNLEDIGLSGLTEIQRGGVYLKLNPQLCYIRSVDWSEIVKLKSYLPPRSIGNKDDKDGLCLSDCNNCSGRDCWSVRQCQKKLSDRKCHPECAGDCNGNTSADCLACRHVYHGGSCLERCPRGLLKYLDRRCVNESFCFNMSQLKVDRGLSSGLECVKDCPAEYEQNGSVCTPCIGPCKKVCVFDGTEKFEIESTQKLARLKGCTIVNGSLDITLSRGVSENFTQELKSILGSIEVINGGLSIRRCFPLVSLDVFSKLREINGDKAKDSRGLYIVDNENLQALWSNQTVIIKGSMLINGNHKLCNDKIVTMVINAGRREAEINDINTNSNTSISAPKETNGDQVSCMPASIGVNTTHVESNSIQVSWSPINYFDHRRIMYVLFYRKTDRSNLTYFDDFSACGGGQWISVDFTSEETTHVIQGLQPYTLYAFYVRGSVRGNNTAGEVSNISYVLTKPDSPSLPEKPQVASLANNSLNVSWEKPARENGIVAFYVIKVYKQDYRRNNYEADCYGSSTKRDPIPTPGPPGGEKAECRADTKKDFDTEHDIQLEDAVVNLVFRGGPIDKPSCPIANGGANTTSINITAGNTTGDREGFRNTTTPNDPNVDPDRSEVTKYVQAQDKDLLYKFIVNTTFRLFTDMSHFTAYTFQIRACHTPDNPEPRHKEDNCGDPTMIGGQTDMDADADVIPRLWAKRNESAMAVTVWWDAPPKPNGLVRAFQIQFMKISDGKEVKPTCVSYQDYAARGGHVVEGLQVGNYSFHVRALSLAQIGPWSDWVYEVVVDTNVHPPFPLDAVIGAVVSAVVVIAIVVAVAVWYIRKKSQTPKNPDFSINPAYAYYKPDPDWEVASEQLQKLEQIGQGSFGMVYKGLIMRERLGPDWVSCAIKMVDENASVNDRINILQEASHMKVMNTHHIVKLLGIVSQSQPMFVIMELMELGDLKNFLRNRRPGETDADVSPTAEELLRVECIYQMAAQIADGMAYLEVKKFVHRDLAARNCMVTKDFTVKIGDFGMTRDIYTTDYYRKSGRDLLPVRWMAPEALHDGVYTSQTDVWSFGVVLWEITTLAAQPYPGFSNEEVLRYVTEGKCLPKPDDCPDEIHRLMRACWRYNPKERPNFQKILHLVVPKMQDSVKFRQVAYYFSAGNDETRQALESVPVDHGSFDERSSPPQHESTIPSENENGPLLPPSPSHNETSPAEEAPNTAPSPSPASVVQFVDEEDDDESDPSAPMIGARGLQPKVRAANGLANGYLPVC